MPLSREQMRKKNETRLRAIEEEQAAIASAQELSVDAQEQAELLRRTESLLTERTALEGANSVLRGQIEQAEAEAQEQQAKHWEEERAKYEAEFAEIADAIETRVGNTRNQVYHKLLAAEERARARWVERGRPNKPARSISKRSFGDFLGVTVSRPLASLTGRKRRIARIFKDR